MIAKHLLRGALAASVLALSLAGSAQATTFNLDLTGALANGGKGMTDIGTSHYDLYSLTFDGLDESNAFTVMQGDKINATVTLDGLLTIPASVTRTYFAFFLEGDGDFPSENTLVSSNFTINNGSNIVLSQAGGSSTSGFLAATTDIYPPDNGMITFDSFNVSFTINTLMTPASVHRAVFEYGLVNDNANANAAVPEPASWALMLLGFGGLGAALRSQRKTAFAAV